MCQQNTTPVQLTGEQLNTLEVRRNTVNFHLIEGRAWVTYDNNDVIVEHGETISIPVSKHRVIISPASRYKSIRYHLS